MFFYKSKYIATSEENEKIKLLNIQLENEKNNLNSHISILYNKILEIKNQRKNDEKEKQILMSRIKEQDLILSNFELEKKYLEKNIANLNHSLEEQKKINFQLVEEKQAKTKNSHDYPNFLEKNENLVAKKEVTSELQKFSEKKVTFSEIYSEGLENGYIEADKLENIDYGNEKIIHDYFSAIEELEVADIKIIYQKYEIMSGEALWNKIIKMLHISEQEMQTTTGLWFKASLVENQLYIDKAICNAPSCKLSRQKSISEEDFMLVYPYHERWTNGEAGVRSEVDKKSRNSTYIFALITKYSK